jgi:hypothetical protein
MTAAARWISPEASNRSSESNTSHPALHNFAEVFPVKGRLFGTPGVAFRRDGDAIPYFWTTQRESILQALAATGFRVSWDEQRARWC